MIQNTDMNYNFCLVGKATNVGKVRKANEDSMDVFETANLKVFLVCDGMGGHVGGQIASQTAVATIKEFLTNNITIDPRDAIHNSIIAANQAILNRTISQPELSGMGSTCVMLVVTNDGKTYYGHVGDSRIYFIANKRIVQLTKDHSFVQMLVDSGQISKEQAEHHPRKNEITNALGLQGMQPPTICNVPVEPEAGNCFLLCSDGLTGMVDDIHIERVISNRGLKIQERADKLVQMANENGGIDNITVQLVEFALGSQDIFNPDEKKKDWKKLMLYIIPIIILLGGLIGWLLVRNHSKTTVKNLQTIESKITPIPSQGTNKTLSKDTTLVKYDSDSIKFAEINGYSTVPINKFPEKDSIEQATIKLSKKYKEIVQDVSINRQNNKSILTIQWKKKPNEKYIEFHCETKHHKNCTIQIPIQQPKKSKQNGVKGGANKQKQNQVIATPPIKTEKQTEEQNGEKNQSKKLPTDGTPNEGSNSKSKKG